MNADGGKLHKLCSEQCLLRQQSPENLRSLFPSGKRERDGHCHGVHRCT